MPQNYGVDMAGLFCTKPKSSLASVRGTDPRGDHARIRTPQVAIRLMMVSCIAIKFRSSDKCLYRYLEW